MVISGDTFNELYQKLATAFFDQGKEVSPRGQHTLELSNITLILNNPNNNLITLKSRKLSNKYLRAEMNWYSSGDRHIKHIKDHASMWKRIANDQGFVNSNYGAFVYHDEYEGKTQYQWCLDSLKKDKYSRQAVINYNSPMHKYANNKDFVCTIAQQFLIRDGKLYSTTMMRSNDFVYGLAYDLPWFTHVQRDLARDLKVKVGTYTHFVVSMHTYKKHFEMVGDIANENILRS